MNQRVAALGLDIGRKRIGVAGCDGLGLMATGLTTIYRRSFPQLLAELQQIVRDRQITLLVVGLPYTLQGELGHQAQQVQKLANRLGGILALPVEYVDERLTSHEAEQQLWAEGRSPRHDKGLVDQRAAAIILQQWLDCRRQSQQRGTMEAGEEEKHGHESESAAGDRRGIADGDE